MDWESTHKRAALWVAFAFTCISAASEEKRSEGKRREEKRSGGGLCVVSQCVVGADAAAAAATAVVVNSCRLIRAHNIKLAAGRQNLLVRWPSERTKAREREREK